MTQHYSTLFILLLWAALAFFGFVALRKILRVAGAMWRKISGRKAANTAFPELGKTRLVNRRAKRKNKTETTARVLSKPSLGLSEQEESVLEKPTFLRKNLGEQVFLSLKDQGSEKEKPSLLPRKKSRKKRPLSSQNPRKRAGTTPKSVSSSEASLKKEEKSKEAGTGAMPKPKDIKF